METQLMHEQELITCFLDNRPFGIDLLLVREIIRKPEITPVEQAGAFVRGLLNLRGQIVTVVDIGTRLGFPPRSISATSCCLILKTSAELSVMHVDGSVEDDTCPDSVGVLVDGVGDVVSIGKHDVQPTPPQIDMESSAFCSGVVQLQDELMMILKLRPFLAPSVEAMV